MGGAEFLPQVSKPQNGPAQPTRQLLTLERAWHPLHQLSPQNLLTQRHLGEADRSWETWSLLVQAGPCVQGCDLVLWVSASLSVKGGDTIQMLTGIFFFYFTNCGKPKAMPKISTNFSEWWEFGVMFLGSPLAWSFCTRSALMGISEGTPVQPTGQDWGPWHGRVSSGFLALTAEAWLIFDLLNSLFKKIWKRKFVIMTQIKDSSLERRWENKKKTFQAASNAETEGLPSCHIREALWIGLPKWSAGQDRRK